MPMRSFALNLVLIFLAGCAAAPTVDRTAASEAPTVRLSFTNHRMGELEPCGCSMHPEGGLSREWELYKRENFDGIKTSAGVTFLPLPEAYKAAQKTHYLTKAGYMVEGMNQLGTAVLGVSIEDALLGAESLKALAKKAKFPFISANLVDKNTGKPLFDPAFEVKRDGVIFTFIGLTSQPYYGYPAPADVKATDPATALKTTLAGFSPESMDKRILIVLSSLSKRDQKELQGQIGRVHFYFGGDLNDAEQGFFQETPKVAWTNPQNRGRSVSLLKITAKTPVNFLHSESIAETYRSLAENRASELATLQANLKAKKVAKRDRKWTEARIAELQDGQMRLQIMSQPASDTATVYEGSVVSLNEAYAPKSGDPFGPLLDGYHETVRKAALGEAQTALK